MEGFEVNTLESTLGTADIYVTTTGNCDIITFKHMRKMKDKAIVCSIHFVVRTDGFEQDGFGAFVGNELKYDAQIITAAARPRACKVPFELVSF